MADEKLHPEQNPAEGSRDTIDHELARQDEKAKENGRKVNEEQADTRR